MQNRTFKWNAKYEIGLAEVDAQHKRLVDLINHLGKLRTGGASVADVTASLGVLTDYAKYHFSAEEALMQAAGLCSEHYAAHHREHDHFLDHINQIIEEAQGEVMMAIDRLLRYLVKWLALHILGQDSAMAVEIAALQGGATSEAARNAAREHAARGDEVLFDAISALYDDLGASYVKLADAYAKLQQSSEAQLKEAQRLAHLGSWELDLTKNHLKWSDEIFRIFEIDPEQFSASCEAFLEAIHPEDRERVNAAYANSLKTRLPYEIDHRLLMADGRIKHVHERCNTYYDTAGTPLRSLGTVQDVTQTVLNQEVLRESEERFRTIANYTFDWEYWRSANNDFLFVSPSCLRVSGYSADEFVADPGLLLKIIHPEDRLTVERHMKEEHHPEAATLDFRIVRRDGKICWISHGCRPVYAEDGRFLGRRASNRDITDRKLLENELQEQAQSDHLTGLSNRRHFIERGEEELARTKRYGRPMSLLMLDIDHFKAINDTHGHQAGDLALQMMADHCREVLREIDIIGRVGGEEFAIILPETDCAGANRIAERLRASIAGKITAIEKDVAPGITVSIGLATHAGSGAEANLDGLIKQADEALYEAKGSGRNRVCVFRP